MVERTEKISNQITVDLEKFDLILNAKTNSNL